jgi:hypothetical protein
MFSNINNKNTNNNNNNNSYTLKFEAAGYIETSVTAYHI